MAIEKITKNILTEFGTNLIDKIVSSGDELSFGYGTSGAIASVSIGKRTGRGNSARIDILKSRFGILKPYVADTATINFTPVVSAAKDITSAYIEEMLSRVDYVTKSILASSKEPLTFSFRNSQGHNNQVEVQFTKSDNAIVSEVYID